MSNRISSMFAGTQDFNLRRAKRKSGNEAPWPLSFAGRKIANYPKTSIATGLAIGILAGWWVKR